MLYAVTNLTRSCDYGVEIAHYHVIMSFVYVGFQVKAVAKFVKVLLTSYGGCNVSLYDIQVVSF